MVIAVPAAVLATAIATANEVNVLHSFLWSTFY